MRRRNAKMPQPSKTMPLMDLLYMAAPMIWTKHPHQLQSTRNVEEFADMFDRPNVHEINTLMVDRYISHLKTRLKPASVNRKLNSIHSLFKWAADRELMEKVPKFTWQKEDNSKVRWLSKDEEVKLLELLPQPYAAFVEILILTGLRRDELRLMQRDQIDGDFLRIWNTKTKKPRSVPMTPRVKELVNQYVPFNLSRMQIFRAWNKAKAEMGLEHDGQFTLHCTRHTAATRLLDTSKSIAIVQRLLGHTQVQTTMRYAHLTDDQLLASVHECAERYATP